MIRLLLGSEQRAQIEREARAAFPRECCGLIEGVRDRDLFRTSALHATRNIASEAGRFEIDPSEHIRILRVLRGTGREIAGCYHSHPNGEPQLSAYDREGSGENGFVWLIIALTDQTTSKLVAFVDEGQSFCQTEIAWPVGS